MGKTTRGRRISNHFLQSLKSGHLQSLLERVQKDPDLELFIRMDYINVYFKGASLLKLTEVVQQGKPSFEMEFANEYWKPFAGRSPLLDSKRPVNDEKDTREWLEALPLLKEGVILGGYAWKAEIAAEQLLIQTNNRMGDKGVHSDYFIIDRQYARQGDEDARPDAFGVCWPRSDRRGSHPVRPVLIEIKHGLNNDIQVLEKQIDRYLLRFFADSDSWEGFLEEQECLMHQRAALGLFGSESENIAKLKISSQRSDAEVLVILVDHNPSSELLARARPKLLVIARKHDVTLTLAHVGFALWEQDRMETIYTRQDPGDESSSVDSADVEASTQSISPVANEIHSNEECDQLDDGNQQGSMSYLSDFQRGMYDHLTEWKRKYIGDEPGIKNGRPNKIVIPASRLDGLPHLYPSIRSIVPQMHFKRHLHFDHMASSQAACLNLFLPILQHQDAARILRSINPDIGSIDRTKLPAGYEFEYSAQEAGIPGGPLGDKNEKTGTDGDLAIAYLDQDGRSCLWLIEHKLTEAEFTTCGGFKSRGRQQDRHRCDKSFLEIAGNPSLCYYHDAKKYGYWPITGRHRALFSHGENADGCPFKGGMNQLWRNQLMGLALEDHGRYHRVTFSVVRHPDNRALDKTIKSYQELTAQSAKFSVFESKALVDAAVSFGDKGLQEWASWYRELYMV